MLLQMTASSQVTVNLAHRLATLSTALKTLKDTPSTEPAARELVTLLRASSEFHHLDDIAQAAREAESASSEDFAARLNGLMTILQKEVGRQKHNNVVVLLVSADRALISSLGAGLESSGHQVVSAATQGEAERALATEIIGFAVIDLILPGMDGRAWITALRSQPATAALPILAIGPGGAGAGRKHNEPGEADGYFTKPVNPDELIRHISLRLRRGRTRFREARRDPTTGTPNRAACYEAYRQTQASVSEEDPISFAIVGIHRFNTIVRSCSPVARNNLIREIGKILTSSLRSSDIVARWGVSEFAIIMPGEDHFGATKAIEKVLQALNDQVIFTPAGKPLPVVVCAGLTLVNKQVPLDDAAAVAERHLYMAFHNSWHKPEKNWLISDAIRTARRSESIALFLSDPSMARILQKVLEHETFEVELFTTPEEVFVGLTKHPANLLIVDDDHPNAEGFRLIERIRSVPNYNRLRILAITGTENSTREALARGAQDYTLKPVNIQPLLSQIRRLLWNREAARSNARMTFLVVDEDTSQLVIAGTAIHQLGECRVLLARGAQDAINRLEHSQPHYLILSAQMTGMPAGKFIKSIPALDWLRGMEIVLAGQPSEPLDLSGSSRRILGSISRPFKPVSFIRELRALTPVPQEDSGAPAPVDHAPIQAEIERILNKGTR